MGLKNIWGKKYNTRSLASIKHRSKKLSVKALSFLVVGVLLFSAGSTSLFVYVNNRIETDRRTPHALNSQQELDLAADAKPHGEKRDKMPKELLDQLSLQKERQEKGEPQDRTRVKVLDEERDENKKTWLNADGSRTQEVSFQATSYKDKDGKWQDVDMTLSPDSEGIWRSKANSWQASFGETNDEGIQMTKNGQTFKFNPAGGNNVKPQISGDAPSQVVTYPDVWSGVDLKYEVAGSQLKESIVLKHKDVPTDFAFKFSGANLSPKQNEKGVFELDGELSDFQIASATVATKNGRTIRDTEIISQKVAGSNLKVSLSQKWLQSQSDEAFPVVIDPTVYVVNSGTNAFTATQTAACTAGPSCPNTIGHDGVFGGGDYRFGYQVTVSTPPSSRDYLASAVLHFEMASPPVGITGTEQVKITRSNCVNGFNCIDNIYGEVEGNVTTSADIDVASIYREAVIAGEDDPWLLVRGEEGGTVDKYKEFDYTKTKVTFTYETLPEQSLINTSDTSISVPPNEGLTVTTQPTLASNSTASTDPDGPGPQRYRYIIGTSKTSISSNPLNIIPSISNVVADSGTLDQPQWVVPDNVLQDGNTYYWQALVWDGYSTTPIPWVHSPVYEFKVDLRNGKDNTQAYDEFGPVSVDFATGNVTTNTSSHGMSALGGALSLGLDYNSPLRSRTGLVGEYFNDPSQTRTFPAPGVAPTLTRIDPNVKFDWGAGSPSTGLVSTNDFLVRWSGYFVAPAAATYQFGTTSDDRSRIYVDDVLHADGWSSNPTDLYGTGIALTAGQVVKIRYEFAEWSSNAKAEMLVKTTDGTTVTPRVIPSTWLQTGPRSIATPHGLVGRYYTDPGGAHTFPTDTQDPTRLFLTRTDTSINQNWGGGAPVPNGPKDNFLVRWTGQFKPPTTDTYTFGVGSDDGARVYINGNLVTNHWSNHGASPIVYGSGVSLTQGTPVNITVEYYENTGSAQMGLYVRQAALGSLNIPVDTSWLLPQAEILPEGWALGLDGDGGSSYSFAVINSGGVTLYDSTGQTHEWKYNGESFTPPSGETGHMVRNGDGTVTLQDEGGQTYIFAQDGTIKSVTKPADDRNPSALQYSYSSTGGSLPRLTQVTDPVDTSRWLKVFYGGDTTNCPSVPSGFVAITGHNYICGVTTSDGRTTGFFYTSDVSGLRLGRVTLAGGAITDYQYSSGLLGAVRSDLANDAIQAGVRSQDGTELAAISYDVLGRASGVTLPAATAGATRLAHTYEYQPSNATTLMHVTNATEPNGFSRKVEYDGLYRTIADTNVGNLTTTTAWHSTKDLTKSVTNPAGLKSTTLYDYADRVTDEYGPAPSAWFDTNDIPLTTPTDYTPQVPHSQTIYEEGINGLAAAYHEVTTASNGTGATTKVLFGNPKLHGTGVGPTSGDILKTWGGSAPITPGSGNGWGTSLTGWIHLTANGNHSFRLRSDDGARLWIGDTAITDDWTDGALRNHSHNTTANGVFNNTQGDKWYRIRVDYYNKSGDTDAQLELYMTPPGSSETSTLGNILKPNYGLATTTKEFDGNTSVGDRVVSTDYGDNPELGLVQSTTTDPSGLALTTTNTYETPGSGSYLRQLTTANSGGATTSFTYYGATETRDNPCTPATEAYKQAGMLKIKTEPDPDGAGAKTPIKTETVYDDSGRVVATRFNNENKWTCSTYDARSRITQKKIPSNSNGSARTINYAYAVGGNPLVSSVSDPTMLETTVDLLGRVVGYRDSMSYTYSTGQTVTTYDNIGRLISRSSPKMGLEEFTYDDLNRPVDQKLDGVTYATVSYDSFSRPSQVTYPAAGQQKLDISLDSLGRVNSKDYTHGNGTTHSVDSVAYSQSGNVVSGTELGQSKAYIYDEAGRLTSATLGTDTFAYSFAAPSAATCNQSSANLNAHKASNRTSQTVNGVTTTYCYNHADRLISSSNQALTAPTYDAYGNTESLGAWGNLDHMQFAYDSSNRTTLAREYSGGDAGVMYYRDAQDRIYYRASSGSNMPYTSTNFGYTGSDDNPDFLLSGGTSVAERYLPLPGGVLLTLRTSGSQKIYSLPNIHGDIFVTTNASGTQTGTFTYEPFGEQITASSPDNVTGGDSYAWHGQQQRLNEPKFTNSTIEMGARTYIPMLGRFTSVDPVFGGTENNYVYVVDPINGLDLTGMIGWKKWFSDYGADIALGAVGVAGCAATALVGCFAVTVATGAIGAALDYREGGRTAAGTSAGFSVAFYLGGQKLKLVRDFGKVAGKTRYYKSFKTAVFRKDGINNQAVKRLGLQAGYGTGTTGAQIGYKATTNPHYINHATPHDYIRRGIPLPWIYSIA